MEGNQEMELGYHRSVQLSFEEAEAKVRATLQEQGFGVLTEIDVKETLKKKLDVDFRKYKILGACHPQSAYQALSAEPDMGLMLLCNVTVAENDDGSVKVSAINAMMMLGVVENQALAALAEDVNARLQKAIDNV